MFPSTTATNLDVGCFLAARLESYRPSTSRKASKQCRTYRRVEARARMESSMFSPEDPAFPDESVFIFSQEGVMHIPAKPTRAQLSAPVERLLRERVDKWEREQLCMGATFYVAATNGNDLKRRVHFQGFCQSADILDECIQDAVIGRGGEIVETERQVQDMQERLTMTVAIPLLFGVPPEMDTLKTAIELGGGFLHKVYGQWYIY